MANLVVSFIILLSSSLVMATLDSNYYATTCPNVSSIIKGIVEDAINIETRMAASLLRLHFHDCFVQGCDASIMLNDTSSFQGEKTAPPNLSVRGFNVIDDAKATLEKTCPGVVSCADILAIAARDSVVKLGGPSWTVLLGRRDSTTASFIGALSDLPRPTATVEQIVAQFLAKGLDSTDMVALSGAHTIGQAHCITFRNRLYNFNGTAEPDPTLNIGYLNTLRNDCPSSGGDDNMSPLDFHKPQSFGKSYFTNLLSNKGLLTSDQELYGTSETTNSLVTIYSSHESQFFSDFASAMVRMGNISPLTGSDGQIRSKCWSVNT